MSRWRGFALDDSGAVAVTWWPLVLCPGFMRWTVAALLSMIPERGFAVQVVNGCGFPLVDLPSSWRTWRGIVNYCCVVALDDSGAVAVLCQLLLRGFAVKDSGRGRGGRW